jgi:alpha-ketoglutarate-dependent taurine dioxygenase
MSFKVSPLTEAYGAVITPDAGETAADLDKAQVIDWFHSYQGLLFRGFGLDDASFKAFTDGFCQDFLPYVGGAYNGREPIEGDTTVLSVTGSGLKAAVPFHGEMWYTKHKPELLWFYCNTPPVANGETTLCSGGEVFADFLPSTQQLFLDNDIRYIRTYERAVWQEVFKTDDLKLVQDICDQNDIQLTINDDGASVVTEYVTPAYVRDERNGGRPVFINNILPVAAQEYIGGSKTSIVRLANGDEIPKRVLLEIKEVTDRHTLSVAWEPGDLVMVDNTRLMHGRKAFADDRRAIYVRLCNPCFDV